MITAATRNLIEMALAEDIGHGDATSLATISPDSNSEANVVARSPLTASGLDVAQAVFAAIDSEVEFLPLCGEGQSMPAGSTMAVVRGPSRSVLTGERTALNFLQHLCGIATLTSRYVAAVQGTGACIVDTRKTIPGFRHLAKAAVRAGGGRNHRLGLDDGILIKDNHIIAAGGVAMAVSSARAAGGYLLQVEVECDTLAQVDDALEAGADILLLDNMPSGILRQAVERCADRALTEASGGVNLDTVKAIAETGVDFISVGALTHSAPAADIALDFVLR